jgi:hypothetical protein
MTGGKQLPIAAVIAGILAAIGITFKLATTTDPLETRADEILAARGSKLNASEPEVLQSAIDEMTELVNDPGFDKVPAAKREAVHELLISTTNLKSYKEFERQVSGLSDPKAALSSSQLNDILARLNQIPVPENIPESFQQTEAVQRRLEYWEDAQAMQAAFNTTRKEYENVIEAGNQVLLKKNDPNLPRRIQEVLTLAQSLKTPPKDKDKMLPGSQRLTYATVFQLSDVQYLIWKWGKLKENLEPALKAR